MYKKLLSFSFIIVLILLSIFVLITLYFNYETIVINPNEYVKILDEVHSNIDKYTGKKISVSGFVYIQDDFSSNNFVIAQNVLMDSEELIIGFLCENHTDIPIKPLENITIIGKIEKCVYNNLQYPIIKVLEIT